MISNLTLAGTIHTILALLCIAVGLIQMVRPKGGPAHRARGYAFTYAMLLADGAAMLVFQFTGKFNVFHVGAIANLICIVLAMVPVLRRTRPSNWKSLHYHWISWSYVGLLGAAATEFVVRSVQLGSRAQALAVTAIMTLLVTAIGCVLIERYRPSSDSGRISSEATVRRGGASS